MAEFKVEVHEHGTIFHPYARNRVIESMMHNIEQEVGREGENDVHQALHEVLRHPTGRYESSITVNRDGDDVVIEGDNVIYGPWLEGVGSRNRTTRFKGYFTFRRVAQALGIKAQRISDQIANREVRRLN